MGWLLELLVEGIREMLSQFVIDMMTLVTDMFTELPYKRFLSVLSVCGRYGKGTD